jgi:hypothetical protein
MSHISGGKVLGKGAYGCIVTPAPQCSGDPEDPNMVAKLLFFDTEMGAETRGYTVMSNVDPYHNFSMGTKRPFPCETKLRYVDPSDLITCEIDGMDLDKPAKAFRFDKLNGVELRGLLDSDVAKENPLKMLSVFMQTLFALTVMEGRVSHFDLHSRNVFVNNVTIEASATGSGGTTATVPIAGAIDDDSPTAPFVASASATAPFGSPRRPVAPIAALDGDDTAPYIVVDDMASLRGGASNSTNRLSADSVLDDANVDINSSKADLERILRAEGFTDDSVISRAVDRKFNQLELLYFDRSVHTAPAGLWKSVIIDYGMALPCDARIANLFVNPDMIHPHHFYFPIEWILIKYWIMGIPWNNYTLADRLSKDFDYPGRMYDSYETGSGSLPPNWYISETMKDRDPTVGSRMFKMFDSMLNIDFMKILFGTYESKMGVLGYARNSVEAKSDMLSMLVIKQDLFAFCLTIVSMWDFSGASSEPALMEACTKLYSLSRYVVGYDLFKRPMAFQIYDAMIPYCEALGLVFDELTVASEPHEKIKYIRGTIDPDKTDRFGLGQPKMRFSTNRMLMHNIKLVKDEVLPDRAIDAYEDGTSPRTDILYNYHSRFLGPL